MLLQQGGRDRDKDVCQLVRRQVKGTYLSRVAETKVIPGSGVDNLSRPLAYIINYNRFIIFPVNNSVFTIYK